jgi:type III secretory pathway component EscV
MGNRLANMFPGRSGLVAAVAVVAVLLIGLPAYRVFFLISVLLGLAIFGLLQLWYKYKPVKGEDVHDDKHPLGLDR